MLSSTCAACRRSTLSVSGSAVRGIFRHASDLCGMRSPDRIEVRALMRSGGRAIFMIFRRVFTNDSVVLVFDPRLVFIAHDGRSNRTTSFASVAHSARRMPLQPERLWTDFLLNP